MFNKTLSSGVTNETEIDSIFNENGEIFDNRMIANVSYGIIGVLAFTSNLVFFVAMNRKKKTLKTGYDILITSLAIADMLTGKKTSMCCVVRVSNSMNNDHSRLNIVVVVMVNV